MVGFPRSWRGLAHAQAARPARNQLVYRPGWRGSGQQPIARVAMRSYTTRVTGLPLNGGQAQGVIAGATAGPLSGSLTSPPSFSLITPLLVAPVSGVYTVTWSVGLAGTITGTEADNFQIYLNESLLQATSVNPAAAGTYTQASFTGPLNAGDTLVVSNPAAATVGAVYSATISMSTGSGTGSLSLQVGPQGLGTVWYVAQVTISTTTGALDTSTAQVYLGPAVTPTTLIATIFSGNGTAAVAIPPMTPGQTLICRWTNAKAGDIAAFNVIGTQDALSTQ